MRSEGFQCYEFYFESGHKKVPLWGRSAEASRHGLFTNIGEQKALRWILLGFGVLFISTRGDGMPPAFHALSLYSQQPSWPGLL